MRSASAAPSSGRSASGVPGRGLRKFSGTSSGPRPASFGGEFGALADALAHADDAAAAQLHAAALTKAQVAARSAQVCVVTTWPKKDRAASRLWL